MSLLDFTDLSLVPIEIVWASLAWAGLLVATLGWVNRQSNLVRTALSLCVIALALRYGYWRVSETTSPFNLSFSILWQWLYLTIELAVLSGCLITWLWLARSIDRSAEADAHETWYGDQPPLVDVFIATYNEEEEIVERTIIGALHMDYTNYRVWVLDDGKRDWLRQLALRHQVGYLTRADNRHAKSGNLNNGLAHVLALEEPPEFIAILDADFITTRPFLRRAMALFHDSSTGIVQTPQHFFNPDPSQHNFCAMGTLPDDQRFTNCNELTWRDAWGLATSVGTSSVVRVSGLMRIGGFPKEAVTEDTLTSLKFWTLGLQTAFLNEPLTQGLAVEGIRELLVQRGRWSLGNMQILRSRWGPQSLKYRGLGSYLFLFQLFLASIVNPVFMWFLLIAPSIFMFTGILPIQTDMLTLAGYLLPFLITHAIGITWASKGANLWFITDATKLVENFSNFSAGLLGLLRPKGHKFQVTAKGGERAQTTIHWSLLRWLIPLYILTIGGILYNLNGTYAPLNNPDDLALATVWGFYNFVVITISVLLCFDLPRYGDELRLRINENAVVSDSGMRQYTIKLATMSIKDAFLTGQLVVPVGTKIYLSWRGLRTIPCQIVSTSTNGILISFDDDPQTKRALGQVLFSGEFMNSVSRGETLKSLWAIARRVAYAS
jgi:cellulose synthase (UDP-forming)